MSDRRTLKGRGIWFWVIGVLLAVSGATAGIGLVAARVTGGLVTIPSSSMARDTGLATPRTGYVIRPC